MATIIRRLNEIGMDQFADYLNDGAVGKPPLHLLENPETSEPFGRKVEVSSAQFENRYLFGIYLRSLFRALDSNAIYNDNGLWAALALIWFEQLAPAKANGTRTPGKPYRFIPSNDYRHTYRHLVRSPWFIVNLHDQAAQFVLISPADQKYPLSVHGEILEQIAGRQEIIGSRSTMQAANQMFFDQQTGRPKKGLASRNTGGTADRVGLVLRQFLLTYDPDSMEQYSFLNLLPEEFQRWSTVA